ncbi:MAG: MFS transporter [Anaerolineales bacterium]|nr:MAG: MFS transporter [Anaerolineales bacterium]
MDAKTIATNNAPPKSAGRISKTIAYYVAFVALGLVAAALGPTLPGLAEHTQAHLSKISLLFTANAMGYLAGSLLGGRLYDRVPGHPVMAAMLMIMVAMMISVPLISLFWVLFTAFLILGLAQGALDVGGNTLLVWVHGDKVGPFMNGLHFFFGIGAFLSPIIIAQAVLRSGDIIWAYWALALPMLPVLAWLLRLPSPSLGDAPSNEPAEQANHRLVALIALFFFLHVGAEISFGGWIFTYAVAQDISSETLAAYLTSAFWGALTLGRLLAIPIAVRLRPSIVLRNSLVGCLLSMGIVLLWPKSLAAIWLGTLGMGLSIAAMFPTTVSLAERRMVITGQVTGWFFVGASLGGMSLPWMIGQLFESIGPQVAMSTIMAAMILALGVFAAIKWLTEGSRFSKRAGVLEN